MRLQHVQICLLLLVILTGGLVWVLDSSRHGKNSLPLASGGTANVKSKTEMLKRRWFKHPNLCVAFIFGGRRHLFEKTVKLLLEYLESEETDIAYELVVVDNSKDGALLSSSDIVDFDSKLTAPNIGVSQASNVIWYNMCSRSTRWFLQMEDDWILQNVSSTQFMRRSIQVMSENPSVALVNLKFSSPGREWSAFAPRGKQRMTSSGIRFIEYKISRDGWGMSLQGGTLARKEAIWRVGPYSMVMDTDRGHNEHSLRLASAGYCAAFVLLHDSWDKGDELSYKALFHTGSERSPGWKEGVRKFLDFHEFPDISFQIFPQVTLDILFPESGTWCSRLAKGVHLENKSLLESAELVTFLGAPLSDLLKNGVNVQFQDGRYERGRGASETKKTPKERSNDGNLNEKKSEEVQNGEGSSNEVLVHGNLFRTASEFSLRNRSEVSEFPIVRVSDTADVRARSLSSHPLEGMRGLAMYMFLGSSANRSILPVILTSPLVPRSLLSGFDCSLYYRKEVVLESKVLICSMVKNDHVHILEWIQHQFAIGAWKVVIFDNESSPPLSFVLDFFPKTRIIYVPWLSWYLNRPDRFGNVQLAAEGACMHYAKALGADASSLLDTDEYLFFSHNITLDAWFARLLRSSYAFVRVNFMYRYFGANGHFFRPSGPVWKEYNQSIVLKDHRIGKWAFLTKFPHTKDREIPIDPMRAEDLKWEGGNPEIAHYYTRSFEDFSIKISRQQDGATTLTKPTLDWFSAFNLKAVSWREDVTVIRYRKFVESG